MGMVHHDLRYFAHWAQVPNPLMIKTTGAV